MIALIVVISIVALGVGYLTYGNFLVKEAGLDDSVKTPAVTVNDGADYVPAKASLLIGQHFSAIAAAGPIVGPVLAGIWFGWLPAFLWIIFGAIFVGGVHDFMSLIASVRHNASSIGELVRKYMSPTTYALFLTFVWLCLVYVIIAFTDITAHTFVAVADGEAFGPGVAASSFLYLAIGLIMGVCLFRFKLNLTKATAIFLPLVFLSIWAGTKLPEPLAQFLSGVPIKSWEVVILVYCFIASLIPVWLLLQPRGYLGGWFLYLTMIIALIGALFGGFDIKYPAIHVEGMKSLVNGKLWFPILFITVACGACSGFHGIVASGTTSKQICKENDTKPVGYGAMLLEGLVAVLALATVMMLPADSPLLKSDPNVVYAEGLATYMGLIGVSHKVALSFALLAFSTFVYDTLDVSTRLARYILQELVGWKSKAGAYAATFITVFVPFLFLMASKEKGYLVAWPIFGTSNQLLASLILLAISVWLVKTGRKAMFAIVPMVFMMAVTTYSLVLQFMPMVKAIGAGAEMNRDVTVVGISAIVLFGLAIWLYIAAADILVFRKGRMPAD